jgi:isopentenyldiphosphate isomerase
MGSEILEIVNEKGEVLGTMPRDMIHGDPSRLHRVVHMLVFRSDGRLLLQKRSRHKDVAPGKWDTSVGGHVNAGETLEEALRREVEEELGITVDEPEFLYSYIHSNEYESELVYTFRCIHDGEISFQKSEIEEVRAWSLEEIGKNIGTGRLSDNFEHEITTYLEKVGERKDV